MKGFLGEQQPRDKSIGEYSDLKVMRSSAGYYIGTLFTHSSKSGYPGLEEPGTRESQYFPTEVHALQALIDDNWQQRLEP